MHRFDFYQKPKDRNSFSWMCIRVFMKDLEKVWGFRVRNNAMGFRIDANVYVFVLDFFFLCKYVDFTYILFQIRLRRDTDRIYSKVWYPLKCKKTFFVDLLRGKICLDI